MEYVLKTDALCKNYRHFKALNNLSMSVPKGAIYGFVGKNGAGKTTLIRLICGLQDASSGSYTLYGVKNTDKNIAKARRRMGAVVETPSIYLDMTAEENLKMQYRILGLDPQGIIEIRELILKLNRERQITVLISSHILDELSRLATHYGFIDSGRIIKEISAQELEAACRKCMRVEVSNTAQLATVLDKIHVEYKIVSASAADIYAKVNIAQLAKTLSAVGCDLISASERDESLESYYVNLIGGGKNE